MSTENVENNSSTVVGKIQNACELAIERLEIKLEHDSFAGPGGHSYSDEDVARMQAEMDDYRALSAAIGDKRALFLSDDAYRLICGLIHPTDKINTDGVAALDKVWGEARAAFPLTDFPLNADEDAPVHYWGDDAGL